MIANDRSRSGGPNPASLLSIFVLISQLLGGCIDVTFETDIQERTRVDIRLEPNIEPSMVASPTTPVGSAPSVQPVTTLSAGAEWFDMVLVPAGNFLMGSATSEPTYEIDETPQRTVYLDDYWIDRTEVTNAMYATCVNAGVCRPPSSPKSYSRQSYYGNPQFDRYPVVYVTWEDANLFCRWSGRRLPTEAEWEKAARGQDGRLYPWGDTPPDTIELNYNRNVDDTTRVDEYPAGMSPYGALGMAANVSEWVADWYDEGYYSQSPRSNSLGPASGDFRVTRGGDWTNPEFAIRAANRVKRHPAAASAFLGFRCTRDGGAAGTNGGMSTVPAGTPRSTPTPLACEENMLAFVSTRDGNEEIYLTTSDGLTLTNITNHAGNDGHPSWNPNDRKIAFHSDRSGDYEIYTMEYDGSNITGLTNSLNWDGQPSWSPDGSKIAFESTRTGIFEIFVMGSDGSEVTKLTNGLSGGYPAWSPDGTKIAFQSSGDHGNREIYVMRADGSGVERITHTNDENWMPTWSPDGREIVFSSNRSGNFDLYRMNPDGSDLTRLTDNPWDDWWPVSFSSDGETMAFTSNRFGSWDIVLTERDVRSWMTLTEEKVDDTWPVWITCP